MGLPSHGRTQVRSCDASDDLGHLEPQYEECRTNLDPGNGHPHAGECSGSWSDPEGEASQTPVPSHSRRESVTWDPDEFSRKPRGGARALFSCPVPYGPGHRVRRHRYESHIRFSPRPISGFPRTAWWNSGCRCSCSDSRRGVLLAVWTRALDDTKVQATSCPFSHLPAGLAR